MSEAQRCLHNFLLQSSVARQTLGSGPLLPGLADLLVRWKDLSVPFAVLLFDLKLAFLVTAYVNAARDVLRVEHRAILKLLRIVDIIISDAKDRGIKDGNKKPELTDEECDVLCETLRVLFNITLRNESGLGGPAAARDGGARKSMEPSVPLDEEEEGVFRDMMDAVHTLMTVGTKDGEKSTALVSNGVNLLANTPMSCTQPLVAPLKKDVVPEGTEELEYDGECMNVPNRILQLLLDRIDQVKKIA